MSRTWGAAASKEEREGDAGETVIDVTAGMSNRQLLDHRTRKLEEQDKALDVIYGSVTRQKQMASVFGEEVDSQVALLGQIESKVDRNEGKVKAATTHIEQVEAESSTKALWILICILLAVLIAVCLLAWYT